MRLIALVFRFFCHNDFLILAAPVSFVAIVIPMKFLVISTLGEILHAQAQQDSSAIAVKYRMYCMQQRQEHFVAPALPNYRDVVNVENAGAFFHLPPASMQSSLWSE
jgi:hypothetical protein